MITRVIGMGKPAAGDDGIGIAVIDALRLDPPKNTELLTVHDTTELVGLLEGPELVVLIDAAVEAGVPGTVRVLFPADLDAVPLTEDSSQGLSVAHAIELARRLTRDTPPPEIRIVAIAVARPLHYEHALSTAVRNAIPIAVDTVRHLV